MQLLLISESTTVLKELYPIRIQTETMDKWAAELSGYLLVNLVPCSICSSSLKSFICLANIKRKPTLYQTAPGGRTGAMDSIFFL